MSDQETPMVRRSTWEAFRKAGLLWWTNRMLHLFGWSIVVNLHERTGEIIEAYPARVKFRGFDPDTETTGFKMLTEHVLTSAEEILEAFGSEDS